MNNLGILIGVVSACLGIIVLILTMRQFHSRSAPQQQPLVSPPSGGIPPFPHPVSVGFPQPVAVRRKLWWGYILAVLLIGVGICSGLVGIVDSGGYYEDGLASCKEVVGHNLEDCARWFARGYALEELGMHELAIVAYDQTIAIAPKTSWAWYNKGLAFRRLGRYKEALAAYDQAIKINPQNGAAWNNKGYALDDLGRYEEAVEAYDQAIALDPKDGLLWSNKGVSLENLERYQEALEAYNKALALDPSNGIARENARKLSAKMN